MPAFAIISGYFSKASPPSARQMKKVAHRHPAAVLHHGVDLDARAVPRRGQAGVQPVTSRRGLSGSCSPSAIFRLILPYLALLRWPLLWAIAVSVGVGYLTNVDSRSRCPAPSASCPSSCSAGRLRQWQADRALAERRRPVWWCPGRGDRRLRRLARRARGVRADWRDIDLQLLVLLRRLVPRARRRRNGGPG